MERKNSRGFKKIPYNGVLEINCEFSNLFLGKLIFGLIKGTLRNRITTVQRAGRTVTRVCKNHNSSFINRSKHEKFRIE